MVVKVGKFRIHPLDIAVSIAACAWLAFNTFVPLAERPPGLNEIFLVILGGWVTSKTVVQQRAEQKTEARVAAVEDVTVEAHPDLAAQKGITHNESSES